MKKAGHDSTNNDNIWDDNNIYNYSVPGQYTGSLALAAYQDEFSQYGALFVPVETGGGVGTAHGHWDEEDGGDSPTGIVSSQGDMQFELMTGWLNPNSFISNTTIQSFADIGYIVTPVPLPGSVLLLGAGISGLFALRRRS